MGSQLVFQVAGKAPLEIRNRDLGNTEIVDNGQAIGATEGSQLFVYDMAVSSKTYRCTLSNLKRTDRDRFQTWFDDDAQGAFVAFTLTIPGLAPDVGQGSPITLTNCRFLTTALEWVESGRDGWWNVSFEFIQQTEGPTGPPT